MIDDASYVEFAMQTAREDVSLHRSVLMNATVIDSQGKMVLIGANNLQTNNDRQGWFKLIKQKIAETQARSVVLTAGINRGIYTAEGSKKFKELQADGISLGIDDSVALGLCEKVTAIMVTLYTPLHTVMRLQDYRYEGGKAIFGEVIISDSTTDDFSGPFADFFEKAKSAKPS